MRFDESFIAIRTRYIMMLMLWTFMVVVIHPAYKAYPSTLTPAEQWVLQKVATGEEADLEELPRETERIISGGFLRKLLVNRDMNLRVPPYGVRIRNAVVRGNLDLRNEEIPFTTRLNDCIFENDVILNETHFKRSFHFYGSTFRGSVDFRYLVIDGDLEARTAYFNNENKANFEGMKVAGPILLRGSSFDGPARFFGISTETLELDDAHFNSKTGPISFELMRVEGPATFDKAVFSGHVRFYRASVAGNFEASGTHFNDKQDGANFEGLTVNGYALFWNAIFEGPAKFHSATIHGNLETNGARFNNSVDFNQLTADAVGFPNTIFQGPIWLNEMSYQRISSGEAKDLLAIIEKAHSHVGAYGQLEEYYRRLGNRDRADDVYIKGRRREREKLSVGPQWLGNLASDLFIGYGRRPWQVSFFSAFVVALGCFVFRNKQIMEPQKPEHASRHYSAFLYSLDLFLPIVDINAASVWVPKTEARFARRYLPIHIIIGWILATFLVAALTGTVK